MKRPKQALARNAKRASTPAVLAELQDLKPCASALLAAIDRILIMAGRRVPK